MNAIQAIRMLVLAASAALILPAQAAEHTDKPLQIIVGGAPGGIDNVLRAMAPKLTEVLGQPVVIENRPGANGMIGAQAVARGKPDDTLLLTTVSTILYQPLVSQKPAEIELVESLIPVSTLYESFQVLAVSSNVAARNVAELIAYAKANPGKLSYVSSGNGSLFHLIGELFKQRAGVDMLHIPQKALTPAVQDLVGGHVDVGFLSYNAVRPHAESGRVRLLAVMTPKPVAGLPELPSVTASLPNFPGLPSWIALFASPGTSAARVAELHRAIGESLQAPEVTRVLTSSVDIAGGKSGTELEAEMARDATLVTEVIKTAKIAVE